MIVFSGSELGESAERLDACRASIGSACYHVHARLYFFTDLPVCASSEYHFGNHHLPRLIVSPWFLLSNPCTPSPPRTAVPVDR
jgi:hypothetical protein